MIELSNYTNNAVIIDDLVADRESRLRRMERSGIMEKRRDMPDTATFSPDGSAVAISITGNKILTTIRKSDGSGRLSRTCEPRWGEHNSKQNKVQVSTQAFFRRENIGTAGYKRAVL